MPVRNHAVRLLSASRPGQSGAYDFVQHYVPWGTGQRAAPYLILVGKAAALLERRSYVFAADVRDLAQPVMRHRILPNYRAEAEGLTTETIIENLVETVEHPREEAVA